MSCKTQVVCPIEAIINLIGGKYKPLILWQLIPAPRRYSELHRLVPHATYKMLTQHLRELERDGLVTRTVYPTVPIKTEYALSEAGRKLVPLLDEMCEAGKRYLDGKL